MARPVPDRAGPQAAPGLSRTAAAARRDLAYGRKLLRLLRLPREAGPADAGADAEVACGTFEKILSGDVEIPRPAPSPG
ncbi:hypothetical protein [Streptomyces albofaciens]|uniref:hypothetical protein n=1 Tax=Streptomyces albofaciens TaxID=66866 RepID=UPI00123B4A75|nr:hypothetical protein [Streptomyces albofaciens]